MDTPLGLWKGGFTIRISLRCDLLKVNCIYVTGATTSVETGSPIFRRPALLLVYRRCVTVHMEFPTLMGSDTRSAGSCDGIYEGGWG